MTSEEISRAHGILRATVWENPFIPIDLTPKQAIFLAQEGREVLYGGQGGGGKTFALLAAAAQYVQVPGYQALILRRNFKQFEQAEGLVQTARAWWTGTGAKYHESKYRWVFPSGARVEFGHMQSEEALENYQGGGYHFVGFDELSQFEEGMYTYLFSRQRRIKGSSIPTRMRAGTNPGATWIRKRWDIQKPCEANGMGRAVQRGPKGRIYVPAARDENAYLDHANYEANLRETDPITYAQIGCGDWWAKAAGKMFRVRSEERPGGFNIVPPHRMPRLEDCEAVLRIWDLAATEPSEVTPNPDWTCGQLWGLSRGRYYLFDQVRDQVGAAKLEQLLQDTTREDRLRFGDGGTVLEREPGGEAKNYVDYLIREVLGEFPHCYEDIPTVNKVTRAQPYSAKVERGYVDIADAPWTDGFTDRVCAFPNKAEKDDEVDPGSAAMRWLPFYQAELQDERDRASGIRPDPPRQD